MAPRSKKLKNPGTSVGADRVQAATDQKSKGKPISLRLDARTRFAIEFISRVNGQSITTVVERAIMDAASRTVLQTPEGQALHWTDFWDTSEGVRMVNLISEPSYPATQHEDELRDFIWAHRAFFFLDGREQRQVPSRHYIEVLWPHIEYYAFVWHEKKFAEHWAAGVEMVKALRAAGLSPPEWPPRDGQIQSYP
jgi:hypothetical protein